MMLVVVMSISLLAVFQQWSVILKRDREEELLFRGNRIKNAIALYVADNKGNTGPQPKWPRNLKDLTKKTPKRYLQAVYRDPITGKNFELIKTGDELHGVRSTSLDAPYNQIDFENAQTYQAIRFEATGGSTNCQPTALTQLGDPNCIPAGKKTSSPETSSLESSPSETSVPSPSTLPTSPE